MVWGPGLWDGLCACGGLRPVGRDGDEMVTWVPFEQSEAFSHATGQWESSEDGRSRVKFNFRVTCTDNVDNSTFW